MKSLKIIKVDDIYTSIYEYISLHKIIVKEYENMVDVMVRMIKDGYCFPVDRDILRDSMECLTYTLCPEDDMNKDRVICQFVDDSDDESDNEMGLGGDMNEQIMQMLMGGISNMEKSNQEVCKVTKDKCEEMCEGGVCKKETSSNENEDEGCCDQSEVESSVEMEVNSEDPQVS